MTRANGGMRWATAAVLIVLIICIAATQVAYYAAQVREQEASDIDKMYEDGSFTGCIKDAPCDEGVR